MSIPESQGGAERFDMLRNPEQHGLSRARQAVLAERYEEEVWEDTDTEQFYEDIYARLDSHPGEFIASIVKYNHGRAFNAILPQLDYPFGSRYSVGAVAFAHPDVVDISDKIPAWKYFPHGFEGFCFANDPSNSAIVEYRDPIIDLTQIRNNTGKGQNAPNESKIVIGNDAIIQHLTGEGVDSFSRRQVLSLQCAFLLLAEGLNVDVPIIPELEPDIIELEKHLQRLKDIYERAVKHDRRHIAEIERTMSGVKVDRIQLEEDLSEANQRGYLPSAYNFRDSLTWPVSEVGEITNRTSGLLRMLVSEQKEVERNHLPRARFYLAAVQRFPRQ